MAAHGPGMLALCVAAATLAAPICAGGADESDTAAAPLRGVHPTGRGARPVTAAPTVTTSVAAIALVVVRGSLRLEVEQPEEFVRSRGAERALQRSIAKIFGAWGRVEVSMSIAPTGGSLRRLQMMGVDISYRIIVQSPEEAIDLYDEAADVSDDDVTDVIEEELGEGGVGGGHVRARNCTVVEPELPPTTTGAATTTTTHRTTAAAVKVTAREEGGGGGDGGGISGGIIGGIIGIVIVAAGAAAAWWLCRSSRPRVPGTQEAPTPTSPDDVKCKNCGDTGKDGRGGPCYCDLGYRAPVRISERVRRDRKGRGWKGRGPGVVAEKEEPGGEGGAPGKRRTGRDKRSHADRSERKERTGKAGKPQLATQLSVDSLDDRPKLVSRLSADSFLSGPVPSGAQPASRVTGRPVPSE